MDFTCVNDSVDSVDECVKIMEGEVKRSLDIVAPVGAFALVVRQRKDWFDEEKKGQKRGKEMDQVWRTTTVEGIPS